MHVPTRPQSVEVRGSQGHTHGPEYLRLWSSNETHQSSLSLASPSVGGNAAGAAFGEEVIWLSHAMLLITNQPCLIKDRLQNDSLL